MVGAGSIDGPFEIIEELLGKLEADELRLDYLMTRDDG